MRDAAGVPAGVARFTRREVGPGRAGATGTTSLTRGGGVPRSAARAARRDLQTHELAGHTEATGRYGRRRSCPPERFYAAVGEDDADSAIRMIRRIIGILGQVSA